MGEAIRMDRWLRPDGDGGMVTRTAKTWEEAHLVLLEYEGIKAATKALKHAGGAQGAHHDEESEEHHGFGCEDEVPKEGDVNRRTKGRSVCWNMLHRGACKWGSECRFSHDPADLEKARSSS